MGLVHLAQGGRAASAAASLGQTLTDVSVANRTAPPRAIRGRRRSLVSGRPPPKSSRRSFPISPLAKTPTYAVHGRRRTRAGSPPRTRSPFPDPAHRAQAKPTRASLTEPRTRLPFAAHPYVQALQHPHGGSEMPVPDPWNRLESNTTNLRPPPGSTGCFSIRRKRLRMRAPRMGTPLLSARRETRPARGSKPLRA